MAVKKLLLIFLLICPNAWAVNYCTDGNTGGAWKLDETSGDYADCTSNANTGVITGTINQSATGKFSNGAGFTNVNNTNINFGSNAVLDNIFDAGGTFAAWIALNSAGTAANRCTGAEIVGKDGANDGWGLCVNSDGSIRFSMKWTGGFVDWDSTTAPFSAFNGVYHHVLVYFNSDSPSNDPIVYFDCSALTMNSNRSHPGETRNTDGAYNLYGGLTGISDGELNGTLDEAIIYNGDLTSVCSALSTNGIDGTHGVGGSGSGISGKYINGAVINGLTIN